MMFLNTSNFYNRFLQHFTFLFFFILAKNSYPYLITLVSGSPIIQDGKLVGAVTHVMVANPCEGYGIFIENMLSASQEARNELPKAA